MIDFKTAFRSLTDNDPFPWQQALYDQYFSQGKIPKSCNLPTGLGKTSVIAVWLIALANKCKVPRRLVYVVNRRTVVDQTTNEVEKYRANLAKAEITHELAVSTLRGQFADNREWSKDPSRPAVICGTVDMIGSRLLFSGYGCGFKTRPLHAGFLAQDSLIVHDEAHLEPAFQDLLIAIEKEQLRAKDFAPMKVMELTATSRQGGDPFCLTPEDHAHPVVQQRVNSAKKLHLHETKDKKTIAKEIAELALSIAKKEPRKEEAIIVFVQSVADVGVVVEAVEKAKYPCEKLTGTLRGLERDQLVRNSVFARFLPKSNRPECVPLKDGTVFLVCTSAGEVGVNISADHLVCDLSTYESMAQRFGRVNRFGNNTDTEIHVVHPKSEDFDEKSERDTRRKRTLVLLRELNGEASPAALGQIDPEKRQAAYTPTPTILPTSDILFDAWSLTSIRGKLPGRPPVEPYLHGLADWEPPQTHIAWREEVEVLDCVSLPGWKPKDLTDLLAEYPLKPHELLCDRSDRVFKVLEALAKKHPDVPAWIVTDDGEVTPTTMAKLADKDNKEQINNQTILLAPKVGGLTNGLLDAGSVTANDVSSGEFYVNEKGDSRRLRVWDEEDVGPNMRFILTIDTNPDADETETEGSGKRYWHWYELRDGGDNEGLKNSKFPVAWQTHTDDVVGQTTSIAKKLRPSLGELANSLILAAKLHDLGKKRKLFQVVLGNRQYPQRVFAKSGKGGGRIAEKYRHEFGSLIDAKSDAEFAKLTEDEQDFVLHIIATHHGRGRPHFDADEAFDPERTDDAIRAVACEVPRRFARLQRKYGRWGLAYLESLLRAGDYAASAAPSKFEENQ